MSEQLNRGFVKDAAYWAYVQKLADDMPPLTPAQLDRLSLLFKGSVVAVQAEPDAA